MSRKVCVLRSTAEVEALAKLVLLKALVLEHHLTEMEARLLLGDLPLPDCENHHHVPKREARRQCRMGIISFLAEWDEQYAQECSGHGRKFYPGLVFSGDRAIGRLEMYG